ncbi:MAG: hypothetical protein L6R41_001258 [Letrouitia leprolyta]|nr:MAG: hypothetical protein L6R41_001258 [Letrouitia leprolyta]
MLSRGNSEASARLRRAKSAASIKTRHSLSFEPSPSDPSVARDQALAAASHAFGRAGGHEFSYKLAHERGSQSGTPKPDQALNHSRSIRFAGPTASSAQGTAITTRAVLSSYLHPRTHPESSQAGLRRQNSSMQADAGFVTALPSPGGYVETRVASQPSSYRKLRKSKSMFNSRDLSKAFSSTGLHSTAFRTRGKSQSAGEGPGQVQNQIGSRLGHPFTFLRSQAGQASCQDKIGRAAQEEAVILARDQFLRGIDRSSLDEKQWSQDAAARRSQKTFKKTVRTSSSSYCGSAVEFPEFLSNDLSERRSVGGRARAISSSFKNRLKRVFNLSSAKERTLPIQHLQATRPHFGGAPAPCDELGTQSQRAESPNLGRSDGGSSQQDVFLHMPPRQVSLMRTTYDTDNDIEIEDERSRVTSWANSTAANTITSRENSGRKRLSIIQESAIVPSRLGSLRHIGTRKADISASYSQPCKNSLYTKLQQRLSKSQSTSQLDPSLSNGPDTCKTAKADLETPSFDNSEISKAPNHGVGDQHGTCLSTNSRLTQVPALEVDKQCPAQKIPEVMQAQAMVEEGKASAPKGPLRESKSMFFPQSTYIERSKTSPFQKAMQSSSHPERKALADVTYLPSEIHNRSAPLLGPCSSRDGSVSRSESIYSRTSSGDTPQQCNDPEPTRMEKGTIGYTTSVSPDIALEFEKDLLGFATGNARPANTLDLQKKTLKRNVLLNPGDKVRSQIDSTYLKRMTGHKREHAQIDGDDTDIGRLQAPNSLLNQSSNTAIDLDIRSSLRPTSSQRMIDRFPLMSINTQNNVNHMCPTSISKVTRDAAAVGVQLPSTQTDEGRENLRPKRSTASSTSPSSNMKAYSNPHSKSKDRGSGLRDNPQSGLLWPFSTPASHSLSSPERIARLRRMYSSNTIGSPILARHIEPSARLQEFEYNRDNEDRPVEGEDIPDGRGDIPCDCTDIIPDSQKMVDTFLSNRRQSRGDNVLDTVFI